MTFQLHAISHSGAIVAGAEIEGMENATDAAELIFDRVPEVAMVIAENDGEINVIPRFIPA